MTENKRSNNPENSLNFKINICLIYENCFPIEKEYLKRGFPPELYEIITGIQAAFFLSHNIRKNTHLFLIFTAENFLIHFIGNELKHLNPDEKSIGLLLMKALETRNLYKNSHRKQSTPGIWIEKRGFTDLVDQLKQETQFIVVEENSTELEADLPKELTLLLPNGNNSTTWTEINSIKTNLRKFGIARLPEKRRNYLIILKFYSFIDNLP